MAPKPYFQLIYRGVDISSDLDPMTTEVTYTDNWHGEADEIEVTVQDKDGRWKGSWCPETGDTMSLTIFDGLGDVLPCGDFEMDEPEANGNHGGDTMTIRGLAAPISKPLRTEKTRAFQNQTLKAIVSKVAGEAGLSVEGDIKNLFYKHMSQRRERDLSFLTRLAEDTGHYFSVRGKKAIFTSIESIDGQAAALVIALEDKSLLKDYSIKKQSAETYSKAKTSYLDEDKKENIEVEEEDSNVTTGDTLRIAGERHESKGHAKAMARSRLHHKNRKHLSGSLSLVGKMAVCAGACVSLIGFGKFSEKYVIDQSTHSISRGGHSTEAKIAVAKT